MMSAALAEALARDRDVREATAGSGHETDDVLLRERSQMLATLLGLAAREAAELGLDDVRADIERGRNRLVCGAMLDGDRQDGSTNVLRALMVSMARKHAEVRRRYAR